MSLAPGHRLGPYEVVGPIGAGGMGEVYRARDIRLQRQVAIKIVPAAVTGDPDALTRFKREAQAIAALSHPNILAIHDIGHDTNVSYAVMELLEGKSLAEVIQSGPIPARRALDYASQIASGLAAAHERGIVHRDIKPANVFVNTDGRVTILDFGLARVASLAPMHGASTIAPDTTPGMIIGTIGYMAPEQVRGETVDHRADIFAFGAVLYEMLCGRRAFTGATAIDTMGAILNADPLDLVIDGSPTSPALDRIVRHCLEKDPAHRFQSTRDLGFALDALSARSAAGTPGSSRENRPMRAWSVGHVGLLPVAAVCVFTGAALAWLTTSAWRPAGTGTAGPTPSVVRFEMPVPAAGVAPLVDVSRDGQSILWMQASPGSQAPEVWTRRLSDATPKKVSGPADFFSARWRDDSRRVSFITNNTLQSADPVSGVITPQFELPQELRGQQLRGIAFGADDDLLVAANEGIVRLRVGQSPAMVEIARPDKKVYDWYGLGSWFPDRSHISVLGGRTDGTNLDALVLPIAGGPAVRLDLPVGTSRVLIDESGALVYGLNGALLGQRFDLTTLKPIGEAMTIGPDVVMDRATGRLSADISPAGVLAYRSGSVVQVQFEWLDRSGRSMGTIGSAGPYVSFDLSPDGARVAVIRRSELGINSVWLLDDNRRTSSALVDPAAGMLSDPTWSPDGQRIAYRRGGSVVTRRSFGGEETKVADSLGYPDSWSRDGRYLTIGRPNGALYELWAIRVDGKTEEIPLVRGLGLADEPRFSPDGHWVAYHALVDESPQIYVIPFPPTGETFQMSANGGVQPRWRGDGRELFFLDLQGRVTSVEIPGSDPRKATVPRTLFTTGVATSLTVDQFVPAADGQRFLVRRPVGGVEQQTIHVVLNWRQLLK